SEGSSVQVPSKLPVAGSAADEVEAAGAVDWARAVPGRAATSAARPRAASTVVTRTERGAEVMDGRLLVRSDGNARRASGKYQVQGEDRRAGQPRLGDGRRVG